MTDEAAQTVAAMAKSLEGPPVSTCLREDIIKAKISLDKVCVFDSARNCVEAPEHWRGWMVNAMVTVRGRWQTRTLTGLCLETTDIQLLQQASEPGCPF